jgi:hypothetical protein
MVILKRFRKILAAYGIFLVVLVGVVFALSYKSPETRARLAAERAIAEAALTTNFVPEQVRREWLLFVGRRLSKQLTMKAGWIEVRDDIMLDRATRFPRDAPVRVECSEIFGVNVVFGTDNDATSVTVTGFLLDGYSMVINDKSPKVPFAWSSPAGRLLLGDMCDLTQSFVSRLRHLI